MAFKESTSVQTPQVILAGATYNSGYTIKATGSNNRIQITDPSGVVVFDSYQTTNEGTRVGQKRSPMRLYGTTLYFNDEPFATDFTSFQSAINTLNNNVSSLSNQVTQLNSSVSGNTQDITALETLTTQQGQTLSNHTTQITQIVKDIAALQDCCKGGGSSGGGGTGTSGTANTLDGNSGIIGTCPDGAIGKVVKLKGNTALQAETIRYNLTDYVDNLSCYGTVIPTTQMVLDLINKYLSGQTPTVVNPHIVIAQDLYVYGRLVVHDSVMVSPDSSTISWASERELSSVPKITDAKEDDFYYQDVEVQGNVHVLGTVENSTGKTIYDGTGHGTSVTIKSTDVKISEVGEMLGKLVVRGKVYLGSSSVAADATTARQIMTANNIQINNINDLYALLDARYMKTPNTIKVGSSLL